MRVPMFDLTAQHTPLSTPLRAALDRVLDSGRFILGPEVRDLEQAVAARIGVAHAVGVSSGTDALLVALLAAGVGPGDEVITTPFTFIATAEAIARAGAVPRFVDIEPPGFHLDPSRVRDALGPKTRAVVAVHLFGMPTGLAELAEVAGHAGVPLIEDAAQAFGASAGGRAAGAWGALGAYSFFPTKPLGALGDGGMIVTDDAELAARCERLRAHGASRKHVDYTELGGNFRLDALQAAALRVKLPHLSAWQAARGAHAMAYDEAFQRIAPLTCPPRAADCDSAWSLYTLRIGDGARDALAEHLRGRGVDSAVYYPRPLHQLACFAHLGLGPGSLPHSERASAEVLSLPLYAELTRAQRDHVIATVQEFFA